jgi:ribonuclease HI
MDNVIIYTDGGCSPNPGPGGWGAVLILPEKNYEKEIYGGEAESTNNRMELTAAIRALEALKRPCSVKFYTDSQYLQRAFTEGWLDKWQRNNWRTAAKKPVLNQDLWLELIKLTGSHVVQWEWVKGHSNNKYNEICDQLVHKARAEIRDKG